MKPWAFLRTTAGPGARVEVPIWYWQGHAIWGMTARLTQDIVRHLE